MSNCPVCSMNIGTDASKPFKSKGGEERFLMNPHIALATVENFMSEA